MPRTSRLEITEVKSEPGPSVMRSAVAMASRVSGSGSHCAGSSMSSTMRDFEAEMRVSPRTSVPSSILAASVALAVVAG